MVLDHISISGSMPDCPDSCVYRIRAELKEMPEVNWQEGLRFIWCNSPFYLCKKSDLIMGGNEIQLLLYDSNDIQNAIDTLENAIEKADNLARNSSRSHTSRYRKVVNLFS
jgi:hypothetical protein